MEIQTVVAHAINTIDRIRRGEEAEPADVVSATRNLFRRRHRQDIVRTVMREFWHEHSQAATIVEMMLDTNAEELSKDELPEILSCAPDFANKDVMELGAGIGRFTTVLANKAKHVLAVDFMQSFMDKNRKNNQHFKNVDFKCADVMDLKIQENSYDIVFSNWLFMYLENEELQKLLKNMLSWLREGGEMFCRESCCHQSGDKRRTSNPSKYRDPSIYEAIFSSVTIPTEDGKGVYGFDTVLSKPVDTYIIAKQNNNQVLWSLQKVRRDVSSCHGYKTFQEFLDNQQYSKNGILRYEKIFGRTYVSTGGVDTTEEFVALLDLEKGQRVLDVGCGIGGSAFYMVKKFGVTVLAIDLSSNMIEIGRERADEVGMTNENIKFEVADATKRNYAAESFDVVYSRDTILHIADKLSLFRKFFKFLRPGGKVLISDYCCSEGGHSEEFQAYVKQRGYSLLTPQQYGQVLTDAGFTNVRAEDKTDLFVESLKKELVRAKQIKEDFIEEFSQEGYDAIVDGWTDKVRRSGQGDQRWGLFYAEKPLL